MKAFTINQNDAGQRLDRFVQKVAPALPSGMLQRAVRLKRIKVNKKRTQNNSLLMEGDLVELYLNDAFFPPEGDSPLPFLAARQGLTIVYEDENLLLCDKEPGLVVHEDEQNDPDTLIARIQRYLYEKKEYDPLCENSFAPALCNRIDRNTGGIVIAAKNAASLRVLNALIRDRLVEKYYLCAVFGHPTPPAATLKHYLLRDEREKRVQVFDRPQPDAKTALTRYRTVAKTEALSLLEIDLLTGRTHQIRAQLSHVGHPLLGDTKYGTAAQNREMGHRFQALWAFRLRFDAGDKAEHLAYLNQKAFTVQRVPFTERFPGYVFPTPAKD